MAPLATFTPGVSQHYNPLTQSVLLVHSHLYNAIEEEPHEQEASHDVNFGGHAQEVAVAERKRKAYSLEHPVTCKRSFLFVREENTEECWKDWEII